MSIRFCEDCGNMLTPSENNDNKRLIYNNGQLNALLFLTFNFFFKIFYNIIIF